MDFFFSGNLTCAKLCGETHSFFFFVQQNLVLSMIVEHHIFCCPNFFLEVPRDGLRGVVPSVEGGLESLQCIIQEVPQDSSRHWVHIWGTEMNNAYLRVSVMIDMRRDA